MIHLGKNLMGSTGPVCAHMVRELAIAFQGFRGSGPSCQEFLHVDVEVGFVRIRSSVLLFTQEVPQLPFGDFNGVCFKAPPDQLARASHDGIVNAAAAVAIQTWCHPNPLSFLVSFLLCCHAVETTSIQN